MSLQADDNEVVATAVPVTASDDNVRNISSPRKIVHRSYHIQNTYRTKKVKSLPKRNKRERNF